MVNPSRPSSAAHDQTLPSSGRGPFPPVSEGGPDKKDLDDVRDIYAAFVRAVTASKIYPPGHESVTALRNTLFTRLAEFLNGHSDLEADIKQNAFLYMNEIVFKEDNLLRSLSYFFYKDGMQKLIFTKGLTSEEFSAFMDTVRTVSLLPIDVGDIVDALWQKDFEHIRYVSPDEFVEAKLSGDQELPRNFEIERDRLHEGRIDFTPEDAKEISRKSLDLNTTDAEAMKGAEELVAPLTESDVRVVDAMIESERRESPERNFPDLMFELIHLEDRPEAIDQILATLDDYLQERLLKAEFLQVTRLLDRIGELAGLLAGSSPARAEQIEKYFRAIRENPPLDKIREGTVNRPIFDAKSFFQYLRFLGPASLPLAADFFEKFVGLEFRSAALSFFEDMAEKDFPRLVDEGREDRPHFAIAAIGICGRRPEPAAIPFLLNVLRWKNKETKLKAVQALGRFSDPRARSILRGLFQDPDEDLRIEALKAIPIGDDRKLLEELIEIATNKNLRAKSEAEKEAVLGALGKSLTEEACSVLTKLLKKRSWFERSGATEIRIGAVHALERMATPAAVETLKAGQRLRPNLVRMEIRAALRRLSAAPDGRRRT